MGLREEARASRRRPAASTCGVELIAGGVADPVDPTLPTDIPDRADWLDVVNNPDPATGRMEPASDLERALRKRNISLKQDTITRHRREECHCTGDLRGSTDGTPG